jgi:hypothetical protein
MGIGTAGLWLLVACGGGTDRAPNAPPAPGEVTDSAGGTTVPVATGSAGAPTAAAPESQMQAILDQHARLGPKPIETLTPAEARRQPTPTDAVMALLAAQNRDTTPTALVPGVTSVGPRHPRRGRRHPGARLHARGRRAVPGDRVLPRRRAG